MSRLRSSALLSLVATASVLLSGCHFNAPNPNVDDTPTAGRAIILVDADARPVISEEAAAFSAFYPNADLVVRYMSESELLNEMMSDSVRCVVTSTATGGQQQAFFEKRQLSAPVVPIYIDAIAVVVSLNSPLSQLDLDQIKAILNADTTAIQASTDLPILGSMHALFPGSGSGVARTLIDSLHLSGIRASALPDVAAVIAQVARDPRTVGFIPFAAISDLDNPAMRTLREQVKLLPVALAGATGAVVPSQSTIADKSYPLRRRMNMILIEGKSGLGTGFVSFVANHKGQRIILKLGVVPITIPSRNIEMVPEQ